MTRIIPLLASLAFLAPAQTGDNPEKAPVALERKLVGAWKAQTGCAGNFLFRPDGTYQLTDYGPAPTDSAGTWKVRWDALPPTLVLTCKTSDVRSEVGTSMEMKLIQLDDKSLAIKRQSPDCDRYARVKK
jgi:hypothetical protein